ncbi:unnamed protein product [Linum tenue]|uniref:Uncharacterized protein n=1 Tax=Linum tenue TaxID=586396 RepID=A0AAV0JC74_9ROSI|nr:unnamed protein product [Linum tenue]
MAPFGTKLISRSSTSASKSALRTGASKSRSTSSPSFFSSASSATPTRRFSTSRIPL